MLNRSIYMGRLVSDPELKVKQSGGKETAWCSFRIAVQRDYKKEGVRRLIIYRALLMEVRQSMLRSMGRRDIRYWLKAGRKPGVMKGKMGRRFIQASWLSRLCGYWSTNRNPNSSIRKGCTRQGRNLLEDMGEPIQKKGILSIQMQGNCRRGKWQWTKIADIWMKDAMNMIIESEFST